MPEMAGGRSCFTLRERIRALFRQVVGREMKTNFRVSAM